MSAPTGPGASAEVGARAAVLINARARHGDRAESTVAAALRRAGLTLEGVAHVREPAALDEAVDSLVDLGIDRLIVGGGDGTLSAVAPRLAARGVALGVIPLGTANDFARSLDIPLDRDRAAAVAAGAHCRRIDLAVANGVSFLNVASLGLSAATTLRVSHGMKRWLGAAAYAVAGMFTVARHPPFHARIVSAGGTIEQDVHQIVVGNGRFFGGGVLVARESTLDDGTLAVYTLGARGRLNLLHTIVLLRLRFPLDHPGDAFVRSPEVVVSSVPDGLPVNLDGEIRLSTPVHFAVNPAALAVLTPAGAG